MPAGGLHREVGKCHAKSPWIGRQLVQRRVQANVQCAIAGGWGKQMQRARSWRKLAFDRFAIERERERGGGNRRRSQTQTHQHRAAMKVGDGDLRMGKRPAVAVGRGNGEQVVGGFGRVNIGQKWRIIHRRFGRATCAKRDRAANIKCERSWNVPRQPA